MKTVLATLMIVDGPLAVGAGAGAEVRAGVGVGVVEDGAEATEAELGPETT